MNLLQTQAGEGAQEAPRTNPGMGNASSPTNLPILYANIALMFLSPISISVFLHFKLFLIFPEQRVPRSPL